MICEYLTFYPIQVVLSKLQGENYRNQLEIMRRVVLLVLVQWSLGVGYASFHFALRHASNLTFVASLKMSTVHHWLERPE